MNIPSKNRRGYLPLGLFVWAVVAMVSFVFNNEKGKNSIY